MRAVPVILLLTREAVVSGGRANLSELDVRLVAELTGCTIRLKEL